MNKINNIQLSTIENKQEKVWFSLIKQMASETDFGSIEVNLNIRNGKITNVAVINKSNYNIGA